MYKVINSKGVLLTTGNREVAMLAAVKYRWSHMRHNEAMKFMKSRSYETLRKELYAKNHMYPEKIVRLLSDEQVLPEENIILGYN